MRTREKKYSDYGITEERKKALYEYCHASPDIELVTIAAMYSNFPLHKLLIRSLINGESWRTLSHKEYIPAGEKDFYGYRRKALGNLNALLIGKGIQI